LFCRFYLQKIEQRPKGSPCFFLVSLLLFFHLFFSSTVYLPDLTVTLAKERNFLCSLCFFFSPTTCLSFVFFFSLFFSFFSLRSSFLFLPLC
jgi:hypothetical protein